MRNYNFGSRFGFTLVELLVVIAIMSTLAAIIFPKINQSRSSQSLNEAALGFISIIRATQANAISGTLCGDPFTPSKKASYWGFYAPKGAPTYYYQPYCIDSSGNFSSIIPKTDFKYSSGISLDEIALLDNSGGPPCVPSAGVGIAAFDNISGTVHFLNVDPSNGNPTLDACQDSPLKPNLQQMRYKLSEGSSSNYIYVFVDKSGLVSSLKP